MKKEPEWMLQKRLEALKQFNSMQMPRWGPDLSALDLQDIYYYVKPEGKTEASWNEVPEDIKNTFDKLGIPEAERKFLAGSTAQFESESVYHHLKEQWEKQGIVFTDMDTGLREHEEIVEKYFGSIVPFSDNKFVALNTAVWSGGSFVFIPKGVKCQFPLQAYFRINTQSMGQFERTMIIVEEGASVNYVEGCSAPIYSTASLHAAVVEIIAKKESKVRYTTIQNWSNNVYNLVTKRAVAHENALVEWLDGNIGSKVTQKYPAVILKGKGARAEIMSIAYSGKGQLQDTGAKVFHLAPETKSRIVSKGICKDGGRQSYRGLVHIAKGAENSKSFVECNAYLLDGHSRSDTYPVIKVEEQKATVGHEAKVGKIGAEKLFYLMSRGISEKDALSMVVLGLMESFTKELPMEYAIELNRLIELQLEKSVG
jgi:Fe-S cluster assembly protein SufB